MLQAPLLCQTRWRVLDPPGLDDRSRPAESMVLSGERYELSNAGVCDMEQMRVF